MEKRFRISVTMLPPDEITADDECDAIEQARDYIHIIAEEIEEEE